jgi:hypothetical protein
LCLFEEARKWKLYYIAIVCLDDLIARFNMQDINVLKKRLANSFGMKYLSVAKTILDMRIPRDTKKHKLTLSREEYIEKVLDKFRMENTKPISTPWLSISN